MQKNAPFDDSQQKDLRRSSSNAGTATGNLDAHRQGVELTQSKFYAQGMVKIHSGFNGQSGRHDVPQFVYGQTQKAFLEEPYHRDVLPTEPSSYVDKDTSLTNYVVDKGVDLDVHVDLYDGVIEPFAIRDVIALRRQFKAYERKLWAALGEGNVKNREGSDTFAWIVKASDVCIGSGAMLDNVDTTASLVTVVESGSTDTRKHGPFVENYAKKGIITSTKMDDDLKNVLANMNPPTENMLPDDYVQLGSTGYGY